MICWQNWSVNSASARFVMSKQRIQAMRNIISALLLSLSSAFAIAQSSPPIDLAPDAPDSHVVVRGDTLWGISSQFLRDPYRWPEVWRMNDEQVHNPHLIYPGQVIMLDRSGLGGEPQLQLGNLYKAEPQVYYQSERDAIPSIPQQVIEPFLSQPLVIEENQLSGDQRIVAIDDDRGIAGQATKIYAKGFDENSPTLWQIYRPGTTFKDPDTGELLGYEAIYLGDARVTRLPKKENEAATLMVTKAKLEIAVGDFLKPAQTPDWMSYVPHAPRDQLAGAIISIYGGLSNFGEAGQYSIVAIALGRRNGMEPGHVLAISRAGVRVVNNFESGKESIRLPNERYGLLFVFRTFHKVSYGLVMEVSRPVRINDTAETP
jgi:hypothetical protein